MHRLLAASLLVTGVFAAHADVFTFSFTSTIDPSNPFNVAGTVAGTIVLPHNGFHVAASKILVSSYPAAMDSYAPPPLEPTAWPDQPGSMNMFTIVKGNLIAGQFFRALDTPDYDVDFRINYDNRGNGSNYLGFFDPTWTRDWIEARGTPGFGGINIQEAEDAVGAVPEPSSVVLLASIVGIGGFVLLGRRGRLGSS